jgi:hypothetical protein
MDRIEVTQILSGSEILRGTITASEPLPWKALRSLNAEWLVRGMVAARYRHHLTSTNVRFDPTQEEMLRRSECPLSALYVETCMAQSLSAIGAKR